MGVQVIISDFTTAELDYFRVACNFVGNEKRVFELRSQGNSLEEIAEALHMSVENVKRLSRKVNSKIVKVSGGGQNDERRGYRILEQSL